MQKTFFKNGGGGGGACEVPAQAEELLAVNSFCTEKLTGATATCIIPAQGPCQSVILARTGKGLLRFQL